ncbi:MAG: hypothetical protein JSS98_06145 [Bacteroidetes bacterium]|nr:hypothetical protein [Bacteroidota bacterium]
MESSNDIDFLCDNFFHRENDVTIRDIYDITTNQYLDELPCNIPPYKERIHQQRGNKIEILEGTAYFQIKKNNLFLVFNNIYSLDNLFRNLDEYEFFYDYELAYFHNFIEQEQYKLFEFCGIAKQFYRNYTLGSRLLYREVLINNGKFEGELREFDKFGNVIYSCNYVNGKKHGKEILLKVIGRNDKKIIIIETNFYELGRKISKQVFHQTGKNNIMVDTKFDNNKKIKDFVRYNREGKEIEHRYYENGKLILNGEPSD